MFALRSLSMGTSEQQYQTNKKISISPMKKSFFKKSSYGKPTEHKLQEQ